MEHLLNALRDDPLPPSAVDLERALTDGRRKVRRRRLTTVVAAGCAVLAVAGGVSVAANRPSGGMPPAVVPSVPASALTASTLPARAPATFDPLRRYAAFGWLPDGLTETHIETGSQQLFTSASAPHDGGSKDSAAVLLRIVPAGYDIALSNGGDFATQPGVTQGWTEVTPADPVHGRSARWNGKAAGGAGAALRWEYAPNAWAEVIVQGAAGGVEPQATARRVAESVRYALDAPIRLPFATAPLPGGLRPMIVSLGKSATGWHVAVSYGRGERTPYGDWPLSVTVTRRPARTGDSSVIAAPDITLDGHPARRSSGADGGVGLQLYDVQGLYLELVTHDAATAGQLPGGLDQFFRGMKLYPDPRDWQ
jgi:hypothetical protein